MKLWALLYHNTNEYDLPEVLAVSDQQKLLREIAEKDAKECFGDEYLKGREWTGNERSFAVTGEHAVSFDNDDDQAEYFIVEITHGMVI